MTQFLMSRLQASASFWSSCSACRNDGLPQRRVVDKAEDKQRFRDLPKGFQRLMQRVLLRVRIEPAKLSPQQPCIRAEPKNAQEVWKAGHTQIVWRWPGIGGSGLWNFTYLCANLTNFIVHRMLRLEPPGAGCWRNCSAFRMPLVASRRECIGASVAP